MEVTGAPDRGMVGGAAGGESPPGVGLRENVPEGLQTTSIASHLFREELQSQGSKNQARGA